MRRMTPPRPELRREADGAPSPAAWNPMIFVDVREFKRVAQRRLSRNHALLRILREVPDEVALPSLAERFPDWLRLLEDL